MDLLTTVVVDHYIVTSHRLDDVDIDADDQATKTFVQNTTKHLTIFVFSHPLVLHWGGWIDVIRHLHGLDYDRLWRWIQPKRKNDRPVELEADQPERFKIRHTG